MGPAIRTGALVVAFFTALGLGARDRDAAAPAREAVQAELADASAPGWDRSEEAWPAPEAGPFVPPVGPALADYRRRMVRTADWTGGPVWHQVGRLPVSLGARHRAEALAVQIFRPPGPRVGTLFFVHGFMSHSANFAYTYAWFTARGWTVVTLDLPGHGLSTGPRADVADFADYGEAVDHWYRWATALVGPGPRLLMAHSLGTAACLEALRRPGGPRPDRVVFLAPLLRTEAYGLLSLGKSLVGWALKTVPGRYYWDRYLDGDALPVHWYEALDRWLDRLEAQGPLRIPLTVYTGNRDNVVDESWNRAEYERLVPGVRYVVFPGWGHLFPATRADRRAFHERLGADLGLEAGPRSPGD